MASYVRQRLTEIKANPALRKRPPKRVTFQKRLVLTAGLLAALGHNKRLLTVIHLMDGERTVTDLLSRVGGSQHSLSQHLALLIEYGILEARSEGAWRYYSCKSEEAKRWSDCLTFWPRATRFPQSLGLFNDLKSLPICMNCRTKESEP